VTTAAPTRPAPAAGPAGPPALEAAGLFGIYAHVPFCLSRCHYCDFVTYTGMEGLRRPYAAALLAEADLAVAALGAQPPTVTSVFVGGGTPTLLPAGDLGRVLARLRELLAFAPDAEVTVEANPETVDQALADGLAAAGVTRVSLGAQSFDDRVLAALGRTHDAARVGQAVAALRRAGLDNLNLDLIFGCPGEDEDSWAETLAAAVALGPGHLSAYALTVEPATRFGRMVAAGRMAGPDEDLLADRYEAACAVLAAAGWHHYEVSNWGRDDLTGRRAPAPPFGGGHAGLPALASRHNLTYWRRGPYLGLGAGAHEFTGGVRRWNGPGVPAYLAALAAGRRPTAGEERLTADEARFELLVLRLRTADGLEPAEAARLGVDPGGAAVAELRGTGLLAAGPRVALTERGMFLHGQVVTRLAPTPARPTRPARWSASPTAG
jgi:coproporphyrinogen III oxidase-like Fe-S oxidoreductase